MVRSKRSAVLVALTLTLLPATLRVAAAQAQPVVSFSGSNVNIEAEKGDLKVTLKQLFNGVNRSYVIDPMVNDASLSLSVHNLPFNIALETLLKASGLPLTYSLDNGVYTILEKPGLSQDTSQFGTIKIRPTGGSASTLLTWLKSIKRFGPESRLAFTVPPNSNIVMVTYPETEEGYNLLHDVQDTVHQADVKPRNLALKVEVVLVKAGKSGATRHTLMSTTVKTVDGQSVHTRIANDADPASEMTEGVEVDRFDTDVKPTLDTDTRLVNLNSNGTLDVTYRAAGDSRPRQMHIDFSGSGNYNINQSTLLHKTIIDKQSGKGADHKVEIEILITPQYLLEDASEGQLAP